MKPSFQCAVVLSSLLLGCAGSPGDAAERASASVVAGVELQLDLLGPGAAPVGAVGSYQLVVSNLGSAAAQNTQVTLQLPAGTAFVSASTGCALLAPQQLRCALGALGAQRALPKSFALRHDLAGTASVSGAVTTTTPESSTANNAAAVDTGVGVAPGGPLALLFAQDMAAVACFGASLTGFAQCTPSSLVGAPFVLHADQTITTAGPITGVWSQPAGPASLRVEFRNAQGATTMVYDGLATSARCVEGRSFNPALAPAGAFRACAQ